MRAVSSTGSAPGSRSAVRHGQYRRPRCSIRPPLKTGLAIEQALHQLSRAELERLAQTVIDTLDSMDPDSDLELCGDEIDGTGAEDDFAYLANARTLWGPGCEISDAA